jgi:hypothetical protein
MIVRVIRPALLVAALALVPASAFAQTPWFVGGLAGVTFGTVSSGAVGAQFGRQIRPNLFVIGEAGRMGNVMPKSVKDLLDALTDSTDFSAVLEVSAPATYAFGGLRYIQQRPQPIAPFVEAGVGIGHISFKIDRAEFDGVDFTEELRDELAAEDLNSTQFLMAIGFGVHGRLRESLGLDVGYRYTRIFTDDPSVNASMIYAAIKFSR